MRCVSVEELMEARARLDGVEDAASDAAAAVPPAAAPPAAAAGDGVSWKFDA